MLQKIIMAALSECVYYQPSIIFLDDIEAITNASMNDEENTPDAINAARYFSSFLFSFLSFIFLDKVKKKINRNFLLSG